MSKGLPDISPGGAIVLGLLLDGHGSRSGYDIQKQAAVSVAHFWPVTKAHVYAELPKLEAAGMVTSKAVTQTKSPNKKLYEVTPSGRIALSEWLANAALGEPKLRHPLLLCIFFAANMDRSSLLAAIDVHQSATEATLDRYKKLFCGKPEVDHGQQCGRRLALLHGVRRLEADLAWLEDVRADTGRHEPDLEPIAPTSEYRSPHGAPDPGRYNRSKAR